jgi:asparagine synthase (glutamine-hydrolysing)
LAARKVPEYVGSDHHEVIFDFKKGIEVIPEVIECLESYDTTTIRASTPMWLLCKYIKEMTDIRVILSGEGSDEILGGYKYFKLAPDDDAFEMETQRRLAQLHQFDVLRADRCSAGHGLELRVPFLDRDFVDTVMMLHPYLKRTAEEKKILRDAFEGYLPHDILHRPKDAFSDAVGYTWVDTVRYHGERHVSDNQYVTVCKGSNDHNIPESKEEAWYRDIFWRIFGRNKDHLISEIWRPKWTSVKDPSARKLV